MSVDNTVPMAETDFLSRRGMAPELPHRYTVTPTVQRVQMATTVAIRTNKIAVISGAPGTGKTTAVAAAAHELCHQAVYVLMPDSTSVRAILATIWTCMTHTPATGTMLDIRDAMLVHLMRHPVVLLIDDAHYVSQNGLRTITGIWNAVATLRGHGVPIVLVGNNLLRELAKVPELVSRTISRVETCPLSPDELREALAAMCPRTTLTDWGVWRDLDRRYFEGNLRKWADFLDILDILTQADAATADVAYEPSALTSALQTMGYVQ